MTSRSRPTRLSARTLRNSEQNTDDLLKPGAPPVLRSREEIATESARQGAPAEDDEDEKSPLVDRNSTRTRGRPQAVPARFRPPASMAEADEEVDWKPNSQEDRGQEEQRERATTAKQLQEDDELEQAMIDEQVRQAELLEKEAARVAQRLPNRVWSTQEQKAAEKVWRAGAGKPARDDDCCDVLQSSCCYPDAEDAETDIELGEMSRAQEQMESEGLYVPFPTDVSEYNLKRLAKRRHADRKALVKPNPDGSMPQDLLSDQRAEDPMSHSNHRPARWLDATDAMLETKYHAPVLSSSRLGDLVAGSTEPQQYTLRVHFGRLLFEDHPLFYPEHCHAAKLLEQYKMWCRVQQDAVASSCALRIPVMRESLPVLKHEVDSVKELLDSQLEKMALEPGNPKFRSVYTEQLKAWTSALYSLRRAHRSLRECRHQMLTALEDESRLLVSMISTWQSIREAQKAEQLSCTDLSFKLHTHPSGEATLHELAAQHEIEEQLGLYWVDKECQAAKLAKQIQDKRWQIEEANKRKNLRRRQHSSKRADGFSLSGHPDDELPLGAATSIHAVESLMQQLEDLLDQQSTLTNKQQRGLNTEKLRSKIQSRLDRCKPRDVQLGGDTRALDRGVQPELKIGNREVDEDGVMEFCRRAPHPHADALPERMKLHLKHQEECEKCCYYLKFQCNGTEVLRTEPQAMTHRFCLDFDEFVDLKVLSWPRNLLVEVWQENRFVDELIGTCMLVVPGEQGESTLGVLAIAHHLQGQVGYIPEWEKEKAERLQAANTASSQTVGNWGEHFCSAQFEVQVSWGVTEEVGDEDDDDEVVCIPEVPPLPARASGVLRREAKYRDKLSGDQFADLDPNDPNNRAVLEQFASDLDQAGATGKFRVETHLPDLHPLGEPLQRRRQQALLKRWAKEGPAANVLVPLLDSQISSDSIGEQIGVGEDGQGPRSQIKKYIQFVQAQAKQQRAKQRRAVSHDDLVREPPLTLTADLDFGALLAKLAPRRQLKPKRKKIVSEATSASSCELMVICVQGFDLPVRNKDSEGNPRHPSQQVGVSQMLKEDNSTMSSVQVRFQSSEKSTRPVSGSDPQWKETMFLPIETRDGKYVPASFEQVTDTIRINIFDELEPSNSDHTGEDDPARSVSWLGGINIPFSHVYMNNKVEGVFRVEVPLINMAYQEDPKARHFGGNDIQAGDAPPPLERPMMLELFMTLHPPLIPPERHVSEGSVPSQATPQFTNFTQKWLRSARGACNVRNKNQVIAAAPDIAGRAVFLPAFIVPLAPPLWESGGYEHEAHLLRLVSTIPFIEDWVAFEGDYEVWCTSSEFVKLCCGDSEEHAVLLCNYFLHLYDNSSRNAYVVIGSELPEGETTWVFTDTSEIQDSPGTLWDPSKGESFDIKDKMCNLKEVAMVFNNTNIWVNIQKHISPSLMSWNLKDTSCWLPFFGTGFRLEQHPVRLVCTYTHCCLDRASAVP
eukprot:TRINITY_DN9039_c0_g4_i2.p1 TRINITY_DN9039_c0_g4~~TRINITY_DN9039_c0_g4_i2.p1  ORF type:complete len:1463 (+),score=424.30 TRINITY_DN9039_c0_g4_i2:106-4494(+)